MYCGGISEEDVENMGRVVSTLDEYSLHYVLLFQSITLSTVLNQFFFFFFSWFSFYCHSSFDYRPLVSKDSIIIKVVATFLSTYIDWLAVLYVATNLTFGLCQLKPPFRTQFHEFWLLVQAARRLQARVDHVYSSAEPAGCRRAVKTRSARLSSSKWKFFECVAGEWGM